MRKTALLSLVCCALFFNSQLLAQNQQKPSAKCQMSIEEILRAQPFDIDDAKSETAKEVATDLFHEIALFYENRGVAENKTNVDHFALVDGIIKKAKSIGMNYSMFAEDLKFIENLKNKR